MDRWSCSMTGVGSASDRSRAGGGPIGPATRSLAHRDVAELPHAVGFSEPFYRGLEQGTSARPAATRAVGPGSLPGGSATPTWRRPAGTTSPGRVASWPPQGFTVPRRSEGSKPPTSLRRYPSTGWKEGSPIGLLGDEIPVKGTVVKTTFVDEEPAHPLLRVAFAIVKESQ